MFISIMMSKKEFVLSANEYINAILLQRLDLADVQEYILDSAFPGSKGDRLIIKKIKPSIYKSKETAFVQEMIEEIKDFDMDTMVSVPAYVANFMRRDITKDYKETYLNHVKWMVELVNYDSSGGKQISFETLCEDFEYNGDWTTW